MMSDDRRYAGENAAETCFKTRERPIGCPGFFTSAKSSPLQPLAVRIPLRGVLLIVPSETN